MARDFTSIIGASDDVARVNICERYLQIGQVLVDLVFRRVMRGGHHERNDDPIRQSRYPVEPREPE
jgi:hypothetical protein